MNDTTLSHLYYTPHLHHSILDRPTERRLLEAAQAGDSDALDDLMAHNQRLVYKEALRAWNKGLGGDLDLLDLVQFGNLGLLQAVRKFDLSTPHKLSTYAMAWVRLYISRGASGYGLGVSRSIHLARVRRAATGYYQRHESWPSELELVELTGLSLALVREALHTEKMRFASLDAAGDHNLPAHETIPYDGEPVPDLVEAGERASRVLAILQTLPDLHRRGVELRYGLNGYAGRAHTCHEIGVLLGFSRTWAQMLEKQALEMLRERLNDPGETL